MRDPSFDQLSRRRFLTLTGGTSAALALAACSGKSSSKSTAGGKTATSDSSAPSGTAATSSAAGGKYAGPAVTLAFWNGFTGGDGPFIKTLVDKFNSANPNIKVQMDVYQWADFYQKLPAAVSSGKGPDVAAMHLDAIATQAAQQALQPVDDIANQLGLTEADFSPAVWKGGLYNGKRYGIPLDVHDLDFYYNKKLMTDAGLDPEKPPTNHDEYMAALDKLKSKGIQGHWMSPFQFTGGFTFESLLWQFGGELFNANVTQATFDQDPGVQALTWCVDLVKKGYSPTNVGQDADYLAFKANKNAFNWNGIWQINDLEKDPNMQWGVAPLPKIGKQGGAWGNSHQFTIPRQVHKDQNKIDAATFFINELVSNSLEWAKGGKIPATKKVRESSEFQALTHEAAVGKGLDDVHFVPAVAGIGDAVAKMYDAVNEAVLLKKDPASALKDAAGKATSILGDNKKKYG